MDGPLRLGDYLEDPWLRGHTGREFLGRDPAAERAAVAAYLAAQEPAWRELTGGWADRFGPLPPGHRLTVFLLAGNEADLIGPCLTALATDLRSSGLGRHAEILVVRQHLAGTKRDDTAAIVTAWAERHRADVTCRLVEVEWPAECATFLPLSRKLAVDITATRMLAGPRTAPVYLITEDADVEWVEHGRAAHVVRAFDAEPHLDALRGWHLRSLDLLEYLPLFVERLTWRACEHALADPRLRPERGGDYNFAWNRVVTAGWNVAFTMEAYALAGGYTTSVELFEDMDLGQRISVMRGRHTGTGFVPGTETMRWMPYEACSDGRRAFGALVDGSDLYGAAPSLDGFVEATARTRTWSMVDAAARAANGFVPPDAVDLVLERRREEVAAMVPDTAALEFVMDAAARALGGRDASALAARQREFLAAARAVAGGAPSAASASILRRETAYSTRS
ncbi:hypothetical protein Val02_87960 [Virgisporangium aliadipatigenens]|uniref:Uncharacterized protein n=1 Tax=Virgisporangium aliadipatigenens TaxID=741659 RepID=A0A8J4DV21_9ACTN|nr:hypothetical protein [Virgisporangium aliadipatigenens]GIJ51910.1 hypothetical protein Val02_87960 [Virgisporangium aliadipatigenens]